MSSRAAVFGGLNHSGLDAAAGQDATPPDTTGSIGPSHYVEMVNSAVAVYSRAALSQVGSVLSLESFMATPAGTFITDPQIQWDEQGQRWFYVGLAVDNASGPNFLQYGFSKGTDPTPLDASGWCKYSLPNGAASGQGNLADDYPKLGHDDAHVVIGSNVYNASNNFVTARIWSLPKPAAGAIPTCPPGPTATKFGSPTSVLTTSDGDVAFTPVPANNAGSSALTYVAAADDPGAAGSQIMTWSVGGTGALPTLTKEGNIAVSSYDIPGAAFQPGGTSLDTLDSRLTMAVASRDPDVSGAQAMWTQHAIDPGNGTVVMRWYELLPGSLTKRQEGTISDPTNDVFNGAVSPTVAGNAAAFFYNVSGPLLSPEIRASSHSAGTSLGSSSGEITLGSSAAPAADFSCTPTCRWGDYAGASPDHTNSALVWGSNQAVGSPRPAAAPSWVTRNFAVTVPGGGSGGGGGGGATPSTPNPGTGSPDTRRPRISFRIPSVQRLGRHGSLLVYFRSDENARVGFTATLSVAGVARVFRVHGASRSAKANGRLAVRLRLTRQGLLAARRALRGHRRVLATIRATAVDGAGNRSTARHRTRIRR